MSTQMTHAAQVVDNLEYIEETTYGTFPSNPTMLFLAQSAVVKISYNPNIKAYRRLGSEDPFKFLSGREEFRVTIECAIANTTFIAYGINAISGTGTTNKSLSIGYSYKISGTTNYRQITGARIETLRINGSTDQPEIKVSIDLICKNITTPSTTDYKGTGSHATVDSTAPYTFTSGGADPVIFNAAAVDCTSFSATWSRNLSNKYILGLSTIKYQYPTNRQQVGDFSAILTATTLETAAKAGTTATLAWTIASAKTITWTNARLVQLSDETFDAESADGVEQAYTFESLSSSVS